MAAVKPRAPSQYSRANDDDVPLFADAPLGIELAAAFAVADPIQDKPMLMGDTNSSQQNAAQNNAPSMAGSLFGGPAAQQQQQNSQSQTGGGLFGHSTPQGTSTGAGGGLFGSTLVPSTSSGGGLFGGGAVQPASQGQPGGGLFGSSAAQPSQTGGLFGSSTAQPAQSGGLFGSTVQPSQPGGLFGSSSVQPQSTGLFGSSTAQSQPQKGGGLFGGTLAQPPPSNGFGNSAFNTQPSGGFFGSNTAQQTQQPQSGGLFGSSLTAPTNAGAWGNANQSQPMQGSSSIFGLNAVPASQLNQPSLLGVSQYRQSQFAGPFQGKLTMGQGGVPNMQTVGAVKIDLENLRSTTRFADCIDTVKETFEACDKMIRKQEEFCGQITAMLQHHSEAISTLAPDVSLVTEKADAAEQVLAMDAQGVEEQRKVVKKDREDFERCGRLIAQHRLPPAYQSNGPYGSLYGTRGSSAVVNGIGGEEADKDLIGNYFMPLTGELQKTLTAYTANLTEIESHMRVIESSTISSAQRIAAKRDGVANGNGHASGDDTVRELADTLRGFEHSILGVAGVVGQCAEGVNELVLGRLANGDRAGDDARRPW